MSDLERRCGWCGLIEDTDLPHYQVCPAVARDQVAAMRKIERRRADVAGFPGMTVDGDVLVDAIAEAVPRLLADDAARQIGEDALRNCVAAGMTVLRGPGSKPWTPPPAGDAS